jgi:hypothetical protein
MRGLLSLELLAHSGALFSAFGVKSPYNKDQDPETIQFFSGRARSSAELCRSDLDR